ncbi:MAG: hypothetical protein KatS3mg052_0962 [Candidatus Roseilinea sp.]|nr:MAG: hypothetical protein KatS3mg052_0962 [Candidatus Roseilinea sp.]
MDTWFEIRDLHVKIADTDREILKGLSLKINPGEVHAHDGAERQLGRARWR